MTEPFYPLASTTWGTEEYDALQRVIKTGNFTMGAEVRAYEEVFASHVGSKYAVMTNSGSSANTSTTATFFVAKRAGLR